MRLGDSEDCSGFELKRGLMGVHQPFNLSLHCPAWNLKICNSESPPISPRRLFLPGYAPPKP